MIEVQNLVKKYGDHYAVNDISFTVEKGKIYGFLGPNGAGKSTVMNIITGYISATSGRVKINGHDILEEPQEAKKCIGYLPELPPVYFDMTVEEYLKFVCEIKNVPKAKIHDETYAVMQKTDVVPMKDRLIRNLSKGYRQRVGLSQALIGDPDVVILDEPSVGLDPQQIIEMRELIKGLEKEKTVILSSHILSEVSAICDMILIMNEGKLIAADTPENLAALVSDAQRLEITVIGEPEKTAETMKQVENVFYAVSPAGDGKCKIFIKGRDSAEVRTAVSEALLNARIPITDMTTHSATLEDIFLKLTNGGESN